jgi:ribosomal protein S18 acetylase RimI-like enzyme
MQTSITTWFKKSAAVKQSTAPTPVTDKGSSTTPSNNSYNQHVSTPSQPQPPQPTLTSQPTSPPTTKSTFLPFSNPPTKLVKNITLVPCSATLIPSFQRLNTLLLPIPYPSTFYKEILSDPTASDLTLLALWHDDPSSSATNSGRVIGGIRCRILPDPSTQAAPKDKILYISTLGVLSPFRSYGVATQLLHIMVERGIRNYGVGAVGAHVWEASLDASEWYAKRGFRETHMEQGYYRRLTPQGAYVLRREIGPRDLLDHNMGTTNNQGSKLTNQEKM